MVILVLRTYLLPSLLTLRIDQFPNMSFELSIPKDICAGVISLFIRLGLKGIIEDIFAEWFPTQKMPISHVLMTEQDKGKGVSRPSGSGVSGPSGSSGKPSGLAGPLNSSEGDKGEKVVIVISSDEESDKDRPSNPKKPRIGYTGNSYSKSDDGSLQGKARLNPASNSTRPLPQSLPQYTEESLLAAAGQAKDIQKASNELLNKTLETIDWELKIFKSFTIPNDQVKEVIETKDRIRDLVVKELKKREDILKKNK